MKLGVSTLAVELVGDKTDEANLTNGLTVTGSSTINVSSAGEAGVTGNVLALTAADNQSVVVTGAKDLTLTATAATGTTGFSIDASAFTGKLGVTGTAAADIIIGGSAVDSINGGNGADIMTGGAGGDTFTVGITAGAADAAGFTAALDTITDFTTKSDKLEFGAAAGSATNYLEAASAAADFTAALAAADTALNGTVLYSVQQVGSDTYVFYDADGTLDTANTEVVKLTGVSLTGIELGDIV
jgi:Ca2+-binding RTX toxin-like protein